MLAHTAAPSATPRGATLQEQTRSQALPLLRLLHLAPRLGSHARLLAAGALGLWGERSGVESEFEKKDRISSDHDCEFPAKDGAWLLLLFRYMRPAGVLGLWGEWVGDGGRMRGHALNLHGKLTFTAI